MGIIQDGALAYYTPDAAALLGLNLSSSTGISLKDVFHPGDLQRLQAIQQRVLSGDGRMEVHLARILTRQGGACPIEMATMAFKWNHKPATLNAFQAVEPLSVHGPRNGRWTNLDPLPGPISDFFYCLDPEGRITFVNDVVRHYGYAPAALIGRPLAELIHPDDREKVTSGLDDQPGPGNGGRYYSIRLFCQKLPGQTGGVPAFGYRRLMGWVEAMHVTDATGGKLFLGFRGCARDITTREKTDENAPLWATAAEQAGEAMIIFGPDWEVVDSNSAALRLFGPEPSQGIRRRISEVIGQDLDRAVETLAGGSEWSGWMSISDQGNRRVRVKVKLTPVENERGHRTNFVAVIRDMTQEQNLQENLRQAQRGEFVSALADGIAHNLNNILTAISGYNQLSLSQLEWDNPIRAHLEKVAHATTRADKEVKEMLALCLSREHKPRPFAMNPLVRQGVTLLQDALPSTIVIRPKLGVESDTIQGDPTRIKQVLISLGCAVTRAMGQNGGVLEVTLSPVEFPDRPDRTDVEMPPGRYLKLSLGDARGSVDSDLRDRTSESEPAPREDRLNTDPALQVARGIVRSHGGDIVAENRPNRGLTLHVYLPQTGLSAHTGRKAD